MPALLTISIPTWNRSHLLKGLLDQICSSIVLTKNEDNILVLVSDNDSIDNTARIVREKQSDFNFIISQKNTKNIGGKSNVLLSIYSAITSFVIFCGDDDRISPESLNKILEHLNRHPETGLLLDSSIFKHKDKFSGVKQLSQAELVRYFYWYMGNATLFVTRTAYFREFLEQRGYDFFNECWPQTQIMNLGLNKYQHAIFVSDLGIPEESSHTEVMLYNSFYLWRTRILDLYRSAKDIFPDMSPEFPGNVLHNLRADAFQNTLNILQFALFIDEPESRINTRKSVRQNFFLFPFHLQVWHFLILAALSIPLPLSRWLGKLFVQTIRGKKGIDKLNELIEKEKSKKLKIKSQKEQSVRALEFEKD